MGDAVVGTDVGALVGASVVGAIVVGAAVGQALHVPGQNTATSPNAHSVLNRLQKSSSGTPSHPTSATVGAPITGLPVGCTVVGVTVGVLVGAVDVGKGVGACVGVIDGDGVLCVGACDGVPVGANVGGAVQVPHFAGHSTLKISQVLVIGVQKIGSGAPLHNPVGALVGIVVGFAVGPTTGVAVGVGVGFAVGRAVGRRVGSAVGVDVGASVGALVVVVTGASVQVKHVPRHAADATPSLQSIDVQNSGSSTPLQPHRPHFCGQKRGTSSMLQDTSEQNGKSDTPPVEQVVCRRSC